jgi:hypothetical protein
MSKEAMEIALEALRMPCNFWNKVQFIKVTQAAKALEEALAKQELVAVWELQESGWETICDGDWLMTLPRGTRLYYMKEKNT